MRRVPDAVDGYGIGRQAGQRTEDGLTESESERETDKNRPCFDREIEISQSIRIERVPLPRVHSAPRAGNLAGGGMG